MPRCRKVLANGKRCKAHAMAGSKFCLFHTPGQKMKRRKKPAVAKSSKSTLQKSGENQLAIRGSKRAANAIAGYGAYLQTRPDSRIVSRQYSGHFRRDGSPIVRPHEVKVTEFTRSQRGRNYKQTDGSSKRRLAMGRATVYAGRLVPVLGYGFVLHNTFSGPSDPQMSRDRDMLSRTYQGATLLAIGDTASHYQSGGSTVGLLTAGRSTPSSILQRFS